ncbi:MAG: ATP-binding protein [Cyclobacteriaceae bacterium]|nr:ATP-binding protein [Cyclobacteriaceae bacterium]
MPSTNTSFYGPGTENDQSHIDDFGLQPPDAASVNIMMDIIENRYGKSSTVFTSQVPVGMWQEVIGEQTIANAILDRIVHDAHRIEMHGESMRKKSNTQPEATNQQ